ncbi:PLDc N-terminal domain-containing protein [Rhodococcus tibetensis]|uniref:PLDc N-terminal domain-containing protein n=1 Tax=Rhodococcus tibetensis TaxID=2965064 RepID=A0ABT1QIF0_9NOCA|nr:PLDc N-terminal domain-containing protein [Rhodococcus sp. FXJ9.536]MCQ4121560.1 PLDc N-terminal domain-containing protein [Rhodococcus sp. FXJ9.536]
MPYLGLIVLIVWVGCLIDVICAEEYRVRHLPKTLWLIIVILLPLIGSVLWLLVGRPHGGSWAGPRQPAASGFPEYDRPGRHVAQQSESDEEFLRRCRERAEEQRRIAKEQEKRRREAGGDDPTV